MIREGLEDRPSPDRQLESAFSGWPSSLCVRAVIALSFSTRLSISTSPLTPSRRLLFNLNRETIGVLGVPFHLSRDLMIGSANRNIVFSGLGPLAFFQPTASK